MKSNVLTFEISSEALQSLMKLRGSEAVSVLEHQYHGISGILQLLKVNHNLGIDPCECLIRATEFGVNEIPSKPSKSIFLLMWEALQDVTLVILSCAALLSLILSLYASYKSDEEGTNGWIESLSIMIAVVTVILVVSFNDYQKERQFRSLQQKVESEVKTTLRRNGEMINVPSKEIVVGDICLIKYGDILPADGILIQSNELKIDESTLTGESDYVSKSTHFDPIILSGSRVMEGSGEMVVTAVGLYSQSGIIITLLQNQEDNKKLITNKSVLQSKLTTLAIQIGYAGMYVAVVTVIVLIITNFSESFILKSEKWDTTKHLGKLVDYFIIGVTVLVVAVPEGLPLAVTISLAYSVKKMMKDNNLVRHLDACETMGNATTICSDKTGTLTTNRMTAVKFYTAEKLFSNMEQLKHFVNSIKYYLTVGIVVCSSYLADISKSQKDGELPIQLGNKTECALLAIVEMLGENYKTIRKSYPENKFFKVYTFNSRRKFMSTIIELKEEYHLFCKGAAEKIISKCSFKLDSEGDIQTLEGHDKHFLITSIVNGLGQEGLRAIALAFKVITKEWSSVLGSRCKTDIDWHSETDVHKDLVFVAIIGIEDPLRPEVPRAIKKCQNAGIIVRMVTGDNLNTAVSIALKCGIVTPKDIGDDVVMDSTAFNLHIRDEFTGEFRQDKFDVIIPKLRILARSSPEDKYMLVSGLINSCNKKSPEIVAVTGDGTNDGPALKKADVGFAMGISGTEVAKEASDIILTDDNFNSIVYAIMWGRNVYDSIVKFLQFQLTVNVVAMVVAFIGACSISKSPLRAIQMLWVNLIMDTFASLALATEPPTEDLLLRSPYGRTQSLISDVMIRNIIGHAIYQIVVILVLLSAGHVLIDVEFDNDESINGEHTVIFNTFVLMILFNEFNARKIHGQRNVFKGLFNHYLFLTIWLGTMIGQIFIINFGDIALSVKKLNLTEWLWGFAFGLGELLWGQVIISIPERFWNLNKILRRNSNNKPKSARYDYDPNESLSIDIKSYENSKLNAQKLWLKGYNRINSQLKALEAFQMISQNSILMTP